MLTVAYTKLNLKYRTLKNMKNDKKCAIHDISSSTVIGPIGCELSDNMKAHIEMMEWCEKLFDEIRKELMIPKEMFNRNSTTFRTINY